MRRHTATATRLTTLLVPVALLGLASCGDDRTVADQPSVPEQTEQANTSAPATSAATAPFVALRHESRGGCEVLGPNCPTYVVWSDGRVEVFRTDHDGPAVVSGRVSVAAVDAWLDAVRGLDPTTLAAKVGPGTCNSCVDGADVIVVAPTGHGDATLDSTEMAFDQRQPVFAELERLMEAVLRVGALPITTIG